MSGGTLARRAFLRGVGATAVAAAMPLGVQLARGASGRAAGGYGPLVPDPARVLDLPPGFRYRVVSRAGMGMSDGLRLPGRPDGMHAFPGPGGAVVLVRNHELEPWAPDHAFVARAPDAGQRARLYDAGGDTPIGRGATTTLVYDPGRGELARQFLSLGGTLRNCSGGATPWGTWISCEEDVRRAGEDGAGRDHGYNFEVRAGAERLARAEPLRAMGRFYHEAVAVDPGTGIVYQTEDRMDGLFYRFLPVARGRLARGGRLEALRLREAPGAFTGNHRRRTVPAGEPLAVAWVALDEVESPRDDLRYRGRERGAAAFARGEGMTVERDAADGAVSIWFMCTAGGANGAGQLWRYRPSPAEGTPGERTAPATLALFLEPNDRRLLHHGDNLTTAPTGDVVVCEDNRTRQRLLGVTPAGGVYELAANPRGDSELAGAAFSPDGATLFVNIQDRGVTLAVQGPWAARRV